MKQNGIVYTTLIAFIVAIGGFLLGYDGSVISGAAPFYKTVFGLEDGSFLFGFSVSCLIWGCIFGNFFAGPLSDKIGRKPTLLISAVLFIVSSLLTALAENIGIFILGRVLAGVGVGFAILIAPVFIAEIAPPQKRGRMVSFNQLLIVIGLSSAYFVNYFILKIIQDPLINWRWMLGIEAIPSVFYFILILFIPESPRWLVMKNKPDKAKLILQKVGGLAYAESEFNNIEISLRQHNMSKKVQVKEFFSKSMRPILVIGVGLAVFQQVSGINSVLYYAPMIFESAGNGRDASFIQAIAIGMVFLSMTIVSMLIIDRFGRKPLLYMGVSIMAVSLLLAGWSFTNAKYQVNNQQIEDVANEVFRAAKLDKSQKNYHLVMHENAMQNSDHDKQNFIATLSPIAGKSFSSDSDFISAVKTLTADILPSKTDQFSDLLLKKGIRINSLLLLIGILGFIAGFSLSLGPVMWAMFSEIFPNRLRGTAISIVGTINSFTSFIVATTFPVQLKLFGHSSTFFIYAGCMLICLVFIRYFVIETKGKSLEELERQLIKNE